MKVSRLVRLLAVPAVAVPVVAGSLLFAAPAFAATATCTALTGTITGGDTVSGCNDTANTGGTGTFTGLTSPSTVNWAITGSTNTFTFKYKLDSAKKEKCGTGNTEAVLKGKITGHTGLGSSVSGKVSADVCVIGTAISLQPGTTMKF